jgi:nucleoside-diphosphate-sugar epimerase
MKALVTGCAGFIGSNLVDKLLEKGYEVIGIDCYTDYYPKSIKERNISEALKNHNFKLIQEDILNMSEFPEVDYVFHLAAQAGVRASWGKSFDIYTKNNIEATQRILEFYKEKNIKKLVYASSSSVYGDVQLPMREDSPLRPLSPYGVTKLAGENLCYLYWKNYDIPMIALRYFTVYGPRQRPDMAIHKFVNAIINKKEITIYDDGTQMRDFTYVSDVVRANIAAAEKTIVGRVFNIGGCSEISVNMLIEKISHIIGMDAIVRYEEKQKGDARFTRADVSRAKENLNWTPRVDLDRGLAKYLEWIKKTI